jgi:hypothetical protein
VWIFFDFFDSKTSTHVTARDAFKRRTISRLLLHHRHIIAKVYINMVFINKKTSSTRCHRYIVYCKAARHQR